jgi:hypothetical protein
METPVFHFDENTFITRIRKKNTEEHSGVVSKLELTGDVVAPWPAELPSTRQRIRKISSVSCDL